MQSDRIAPRHQLPNEERDAVVSTIGEVASRFEGVDCVFVFGSFLNGSDFADLDVGVVLADAGDWRLPGRLEAALDDALGRPPYPVQVVPLNDAPPSFRRSVVEQGKPAFERGPGLAKEFRVRSISQDIERHELMRIHEQDR